MGNVAMAGQCSCDKAHNAIRDADVGHDDVKTSFPRGHGAQRSPTQPARGIRTKADDDPKLAQRSRFIPEPHTLGALTTHKMTVVGTCPAVHNKSIAADLQAVCQRQ